MTKDAMENFSTKLGAQRDTTTKLFDVETVLEFKPGVVILSRYEIIDLLGKGGMGSVYKVKHVSTGATYALKFLHKQQTNDATWRRFDIEAKTSNKLDHPNLIKVHESGLLPDGQPFFIMDLVDGESLADLLKRVGRITVNEAVKIFVQVGFALSYAHSNGVIHRDIKPSNIMLQNANDGTTIESTVKVVDFGIAKLTGQDEFNAQTLTRTGEIFGSPIYMSPEQCMGTGVDHRSDLYSLGCVIYEALTGAPPLVGESALSTMMKHQNEDALPMKEASLGIDYPERIEFIVHKLLAKEIGERYQSAQLFTADLVNYDMGHAQAKTVTSTLKSIKPTGIHRTKQKSNAIVYTSAGLVLFAAGLGFGYFLPHEQQKISKLPDIRSDQFLGAEEDEELLAIKVERKALSKLEKSNQLLSTIDRKEGLRIFHFPEFKVGEIYQVNSKTVPAKETVQFPLEAKLEFNPSEQFKEYPKLFERFSDDDFISLNLSTDREHIDATGDILCDVNKELKHCTHFKNIETLHLENSNLSLDGLSSINKFSKMSQLYFSNTPLTTKELATYKHFQQLSLLKLKRSESVTAVLEKLRNSKILDNLSICETYTTDTDAKILGTLKNLGTLELRNTKITDAAIGELPLSLKKLNVEQCNLTPASFKAFSRLKNLRELTISTQNFPPEKKLELAKLLHGVEIHEGKSSDNF